MTTNTVNGQTVTPPPIIRNWWERNWKWVVPVTILGCLAGLACFVGMMFLMGSALFKGNDAYRGAIARVRSSPAVVHELGEPIEPGWRMTGSININGPSGSADFSMSLRGSIRRGTLYVTAEKQADRWHYKVLEVEVEDKADRIDLLREDDDV